MSGFPLLLPGDRNVRAAAQAEVERAFAARARRAVPGWARGVRLGNSNLAAGSPAQACAANAVKTGRAQVRAADVLPFIEQARRAGAITLQQFADALAPRGVPTPSGRGGRWYTVQVARIVGRYRRAPDPSAVLLTEAVA